VSKVAFVETAEAKGAAAEATRVETPEAETGATEATGPKPGSQKIRTWKTHLKLLIIYS
jgi:hypothetical protein